MKLLCFLQRWGIRYWDEEVSLQYRLSWRLASRNMLYYCIAAGAMRKFQPSTDIYIRLGDLHLIGTISPKARNEAVRLQYCKTWLAEKGFPQKKSVIVQVFLKIVCR